MNSNQQTVHLARSGMYLTAYDQTVDAGSFCANFLIAIFDSLEFGLPTQVDVVSTGHYIALTALGCSLAIAQKQTAHLPSIFDSTNQVMQQPTQQEAILLETYPSLAFLQPIVWFSESCLVDLSLVDLSLVDVSMATTSYRQIFLQGVPSTQAVERPRNGEPPRMSFCFTLPAESFGKTPLQATRLKQIVCLWQAKDLLRGLPEKKKSTKLHFQWLVQAEDYFTLRITVKPQFSLPMPIHTPIHRAPKQTHPDILPVG